MHTDTSSRTKLCAPFIKRYPLFATRKIEKVSQNGEPLWGGRVRRVRTQPDATVENDGNNRECK